MDPVTQELDGGVVITHPHRDEAIVKSTRAVVVILLFASAAIVFIITAGGWAVLEGMIPIDIAFILSYAALGYYAMRWNRGVLPVAATLAVLLMIFAAAAGPSWLSQAGGPYTQPAIGASLLGILALALVPLQIALIVFAMRGFKQGWNVEVEVPASGLHAQGA
ncbi:MAG TPA: hypothetical protein VMA83_04530 [Solirubrobacteraceae bacterium]|nr:hypothetical protein [Solirubrobacteraceae bacterium]